MKISLYNTILIPSLYLIIRITLDSLLLINATATTEVLRPRGVPLSKKSFYDPGKDFQCFDGSASIPFLWVNDDYCDCNDGSDEPGTSACSNGLFHCSNIGFVEKIIPSSRVNDGICDCCDASDEYNSSTKCINNCLQLGDQMRREQEEYLELLRQGNKIRQTYIELAKQKIEEAKKQVENLKADLAGSEEIKNGKLEMKNQAEQLEKEALEAHRLKEEELRNQRETEELKRKEIEESNRASVVFKKLDINQDGFVSIDEVKTISKFDRNHDGQIDDDEAKFYLNALDKVDSDQFLDQAWPLIKPIIDSINEFNEQSHKSASNDAASENANDSAEIDESLDENAEDESLDQEENENNYSAKPEQNANLPDANNMGDEFLSKLEYDESTKQIMDEARKARDEYNAAQSKCQDIQTKLREVEVLLETDFGPDGEYLALKDQCFELHENEYIYKLCPFESASQKSKDGGSETNLGRWGKWSGSEQNHYERFIMDGGVQCWNGPSRSVIVHVSCGSENQLTRASEPNRCEYSFDFKTPAACSINHSSGIDQKESFDSHHTEL
ncbi:glucosidase 2 subunit beta-like protein 1 [Sarcoptes scabiei]|uniref:Glucosidase 2 subunit beta n=1 Tax=Sarcoptes scabiei TaxID=52283 RepID=A0A132A4G4_SARSC|nr:glucosidase 2 subunit beta-like protein 1 [Sarcoptes scabiei]